MPVRNEEAFVEAAVASVLQQDHPNLEVLVIDGDSSDQTAEVVQHIASADSRVRLLSNPAVSIPAGLNVGLVAARGSYLARVDAHAQINESYVSIGVAHLSAEPGVAAVGGQRQTVASTRVGKAIGVALTSPFGVGDSINHYGTRVQKTDHASFGVYRTAVAREVGGWDESLLANEDVDFDFRILGLGHEILYDPAMHIYWHVRETLPDLSHQYRRYGRGKGAMIRKNGVAAVRLRHLAPPALLAKLTLAAGVALSGHPRTAAAMVAPYAGLLTLATAKTRSQISSEGASQIALPAALMTMHLSWGAGFYEGLLGRTAALGSQR